MTSDIAFYEWRTKVRRKTSYLCIKPKLSAIFLKGAVEPLLCSHISVCVKCEEWLLWQRLMVFTLNVMFESSRIWRQRSKKKCKRYMWMNLYNQSIGMVTYLLGPIYTKRQVIGEMTLAILFSLKTMESLQNEVATLFQATPLFSMRIVSLASSQSFHNVDTDARYKWALTAKTLANSNRLYNHSVQNWTLVKLFCMYSVDSQKVFSSGTTICASWTRPSEQQTWKSRCTF